MTAKPLPVQDYDEHNVLGTDIHEGSDAPRVETNAPSEWEVVRVVGTENFDRYTLNTGVTLRHTFKNDRVACFSCLSADRCKHVVVVRRYITSLRAA